MQPRAPFPGCGCNNACFDRACVLRFEQKETLCGLINTPRTDDVINSVWCVRLEISKVGRNMQTRSVVGNQLACGAAEQCTMHARARDHTH